MGTFWKVMVGLLLTVPVGAYAIGTLATSQADMPAERDPMVISDSPSDETTKSRKSSPGQSAKPKEGKSPQLAAPPTASGDNGDDGADDGDDDSGDDDIGGGGDNGEIEVVKPRPEKLGGGGSDQDDDDGDDDDGDD